MKSTPPSYHDLHITTPTMPRISIFNLPYRIQVLCTRVSGWEVWAMADGGLPEKRLGSEYDSEVPMRLDVDGHVICDSIDKVWPPEDEDEPPSRAGRDGAGEEGR